MKCFSWTFRKLVHSTRMYLNIKGSPHNSHVRRSSPDNTYECVGGCHPFGVVKQYEITACIGTPIGGDPIGISPRSLAAQKLQSLGYHGALFA